MKYNVYITKYNAICIEVEAENVDQAVEIAEDMRYDTEIQAQFVDEEDRFVVSDVYEGDNSTLAWTYFTGTKDEAVAFAQEWEALLGTEVSYDLTSNGSGDEAWYCTASVTQEQIDEFNMGQDWFTK
jgi:hypothetical protein